MFEIQNGALRYKGAKPKTPDQAWHITQAKWNFILQHIDEVEYDGSVWTCGLCMLYSCFPNRHHFKNPSPLCPVAAYTKAPGCRDTPYGPWHHAVSRSDPDLSAVERFAREGVAFLKKVRESESEPEKEKRTND